jgi:hypothetical protein
MRCRKLYKWVTQKQDPGVCLACSTPWSRCLLHDDKCCAGCFHPSASGGLFSTRND